MKPQILNKIQQVLQSEMYRRGITADLSVCIISGEVRVSSKPFNTTPVIFHHMSVESTKTPSMKERRDNAGTWIELELELFYSCNPFGKGKRVTQPLFTFSCTILDETIAHATIHIDAPRP